MGHGFKNSITALIETSLLNILMTFLYNVYFIPPFQKSSTIENARQACHSCDCFKID